MAPERQPRLRLIAGPNGSGKSSIVPLLARYSLGVYLNADEVEAAITSEEGWDPTRLHPCISVTQLSYDLPGASILISNPTDNYTDGLVIEGTVLRSPRNEVSSYLCSALLECVRSQLLANRVSLTMETVLSHRSKVDLLCTVRDLGYRTYLYFVATESPEINIQRIRIRKEFGGHDVPEEKVRQRYIRSLAQLIDAIQCTDRAYVFDNSVNHHPLSLLAEFDSGGNYQLHSEVVPKWFATSIERRMST